LSIDYDQIALNNYKLEQGPLSNDDLRSYFDRCFDCALEQSGLYPAFGCINCALESVAEVVLGEKPAHCPRCGSDRVFQMATFQGRAPVYGSTFTSAVRTLFELRFDIELLNTPQNTKTHDLEASPRIAIEVKGSARRIRLHDGSTVPLDRPGMLRSDTEKKAEANARNYKRFNSYGTFFVVTNALPSRLRGIRTDDIDGYFDLTKVDRVEAFVREVRKLLTRHH
jgi:hypothetical protein